MRPEGRERYGMSVKVTIKRFFQDWGAKAWFLVNMFFSVVYLLWRIFFTIPFGYGPISIFAGVALLLIEILGMVEAFVHYINMYNLKMYELPEVPEALFPDVDIFVSTYSESTELLEKTLLGCKRMEYPDKSKVHIYLCDDGHRGEMKALAAMLGVHYLDRDSHEGAKAGNLNHALGCTHSPYVVTFDADMVPRSCFLMKTIPYFVDAEMKNRDLPEGEKIRLGFVQTPQSFYDLDLFQFNLFSERRIPNEQDYFYRDIQVARTRTNSVIYGGSNTVLSRSALEEVGGFFMGAITEDFATGLLIEKKGYVSLGIGEALASGMNANSLHGLVQQRTRWARGVIATGRKMHIYTSKDLSFSQKMNYWASVWYWYAPLKRLVYIMSPILYATFGFMVFRCTLAEVLLFWLPMYVSSNISLRTLSNNIRTTKWTAVYETALFPFLLVPVLLESVGISLKKFKVTEKGRQKNQKSRNVIYMIPFLILIILSVIGIVNCVLIMFNSGSFGPIVVLFWLVNNLFMLVMSIFFVDGRVPYRSAERVQVQLPCRVVTRGVCYDCVTNDISEGGISLRTALPHYLAEDEEIRIWMQTEKYAVDLGVKPVYVTQVKRDEESQWQYAFRIVDEGDSHDHWLAILYDRIPTLPMEISQWSGFYEDLSLNLWKRFEQPFSQKRHMPRITVNSDVPCSADGRESVQLHDFNYVGVTVSDDDFPEAFTLHLEECPEIECAFNRVVQQYRFYDVTNTETIYATQEGCDRIMEAILKLASSENTPEGPAGRVKQEEFSEMDAVLTT